MFQLMKSLDKYKIILASKSPRRQDLLKMIGLEFKVKPSNIIENNHDNLDPLDYAMYNASSKAAVVAEKYPKALVISADTIVVFGNQIIEKPEDTEHAFEILSKLNGSTHTVITAFGITIKNENISQFNYEKTKVTFRKLSHKEIADYIKTKEPFDKAGGYGAQGLGSLLIEKVEGCFFNVVGFPIGKFYILANNILKLNNN